MMAFEHQYVHIRETSSSMLIRQLPVEMLDRPSVGNMRQYSLYRENRLDQREVPAGGERASRSTALWLGY
jgi:hypothetical protein